MKVLRKFSENSRSGQILRKMAEEGKITVLTAEESYAIDRRVAKAMEQVHDEYLWLCRNNSILFRRARGLGKGLGE